MSTSFDESYLDAVSARVRRAGEAETTGENAIVSVFGPYPANELDQSYAHDAAKPYNDPSVKMLKYSGWLLGGALLIALVVIVAVLLVFI
jgi:hypothetical protein